MDWRQQSYKMYPQHMSVLMFRTFQKGWRSGMDAELDRFKKQLEIDKTPANEQPKLIADKTAELEQMGKEARQQFLGMMGMSFLFGGASGLPLFFIFSGVAKAFHAVFAMIDKIVRDGLPLVEQLDENVGDLEIPEMPVPDLVEEDECP